MSSIQSMRERTRRKKLTKEKPKRKISKIYLENQPTSVAAVCFHCLNAGNKQKDLGTPDFAFLENKIEGKFLLLWSFIPFMFEHSYYVHSITKN